MKSSLQNRAFGPWLLGGWDDLQSQASTPWQPWDAFSNTQQSLFHFGSDAPYGDGGSWCPAAPRNNPEDLEWLHRHFARRLGAQQVHRHSRSKLPSPHPSGHPSTWSRSASQCQHPDLADSVGKARRRYCPPPRVGHASSKSEPWPWGQWCSSLGWLGSPPIPSWYAHWLAKKVPLDLPWTQNETWCRSAQTPW